MENQETDLSEVLEEMIFFSNKYTNHKYNKKSNHGFAIRPDLFRWIDEDMNLSEKLKQELHKRIEFPNKNEYNKFQLSFKQAFPIKEENKMLSLHYYDSYEKSLTYLFYYWNLIYYFSPYPVDNNWEIVLENLLVKFISNKTAPHPDLALIMSLYFSVEDANQTPYFNRLNKDFTIKLLDNHYVVNSVAERLKMYSAIRQGDILLEVDGETVQNMENKLKEHIKSSSTSATQKELMSSIIGKMQKKTLIKIQKPDGTIVVDTFHINSGEAVLR